MKRKRSAWAWSGLKAAIGVLLAAAALDASGLAIADPASESTSQAPALDPAEPRIEPTEETDVHVPGTLYEDGPASIPFEQLSPADQDGVMHMAEWVDTRSGHEVASGWSASVTRPSVEAAKARRAEYASGTNGLADVGIE